MEEIKQTMLKQIEFLKGVATTCTSLKTVLEMKHLSIKAEFMQLIAAPDSIVGGGARLAVLNKYYDKMKFSMCKFEENIYRVLGTPASWFAVRADEVENFIRANPWIAVPVTGCVGAFLGGVYAFVADLGCKACTAWVVAEHVAIGAVAGVGVGLGVLVAFLGIQQARRWLRGPQKTDIQIIEELVEAFKSAPEDEFLEGLDDIIQQCAKFAAQLPETGEQLCLACHSEGPEVVQPVRARNCKGRHYMCTPCWVQYLQTPGGSSGKCAVCRV